jgi:hypothetical protein
MGYNSNMVKNYLLSFMISCYLIPIYYIYSFYNENNSVSKIICNEEVQNIIFSSMCLMAFGTLLYEIERGDIFSFLILDIMIFGIFGCIIISDKNIIHYLFAVIVFISIYLFMGRHYYLTGARHILSLSLFLQTIVAIILVYFFIVNFNMDWDMFFLEVFYILNYAFFYIYLHFI